MTLKESTQHDATTETHNRHFFTII